MNRSKFLFAATALIAGLVFAGQANASGGHDLVVTSGLGDGINVGSGTGIDNGTVYGGDGNNAKLDSASLPFIYCVDLTHTVSLGAEYKQSIVLNDGTVNNGDGPYSGLVGGNTVVADEIAYLLVQHGSGYQGDLLKQAELQAAIWTLEYGPGGNNVPGFGVSSINGNTGTGVGDPLTLMAGLVSDAQAHYTVGERGLVDWLTPANSGNFTNGVQTSFNQGLVTIIDGKEHELDIPTPEPSALAIAGLGALGFLGYGWRRRKSS